MEVHPPEHAIHNWRDFLVHIGTITIGLLIAIGLEGLVEQAHHRHLLHTAEDNLRDELHDNRAVLATDQRALSATQAHLEQMVAALEAAQAHRPGPPDPSLSWEWNSPQAAAWDTARDSGAITLMIYKQAPDSPWSTSNRGSSTIRPPSMSGISTRSGLRSSGTRP